MPNLPFFFCAWRSWSHYRGICFFWDHLVLLVSYANFLIAYRSSQYLQSLLEHDIIDPEPNEPLDELYKLYAPTTPSASNDDPHLVSKSKSSSSSEFSIPKTNPDGEPQNTLLLGSEAVPAILSLFGLESTTGADLRRAIDQARLRVSKGRL